jgi:hypothetical protein
MIKYSYFTLSLCYRIGKTNTIQQDNISANSCTNALDRRSNFSWGMIQGILDPAFAAPAAVGDILV